MGFLHLSSHLRPASPEEEQNEFGYDDDQDLMDKPGVQVKALYDYESVEADELSFRTGNSLSKLLVAFLTNSTPPLPHLLSSVNLMQSSVTFSGIFSLHMCL